MKTISLTAKNREASPKVASTSRKQGRIPAIVYGHNVKNVTVDLDYVEFARAFREAGESSLISLTVDAEKEPRLVLVHDMQRDPVTDKVTHIDFLQPSLKEKVSVHVPLVVEGEAPAVKELGGTLVKNIGELEISALPQNLPHEIMVDISVLKTLEDRILAKDIKLPADVELEINPEEIVISVAAQEDVDAELAETIEENVEDVAKVEKEKKEDDIVPETPEEKAE